MPLTRPALFDLTVQDVNGAEQKFRREPYVWIINKIKYLSQKQLESVTIERVNE